MNECIQFLVNRAPKPLHHGAPDNTALSQDTVATMLGCIQPFIRYLVHMYSIINYYNSKYFNNRYYTCTCTCTSTLEPKLVVIHGPWSATYSFIAASPKFVFI